VLGPLLVAQGTWIAGTSSLHVENLESCIGLFLAEAQRAPLCISLAVVRCCRRSLRAVRCARHALRCGENKPTRAYARFEIPNAPTVASAPIWKVYP
jgi:hypothetical protein